MAEANQQTDSSNKLAEENGAEPPSKCTSWLGLNSVFLS